jgi:hypothetical protein
MIRQVLVWACIVILGCVPRIGFAADRPGLVTVASNNSVAETIQRFEDAIRSKGWMVFTRLDHAAAAEKYEQKLLPRTVIVFGNPWTGNGQYGEGSYFGDRPTAKSFGVARRQRQGLAELQFGAVPDGDNLWPPRRSRAAILQGRDPRRISEGGSGKGDPIIGTVDRSCEVHGGAVRR